MPIVVKKKKKSAFVVVKSAWNLFLDCLYPRRCPVCGEIVTPKGSLICPDCEKQLSWVTGPVCKSCGRQVTDETAEYCPDCMRRSHLFDSGFSLCNYNEAARKSMGKIKYQGRREYLDFYGSEMAKRLGKQIMKVGADALVPVPVHPARKRKRGFNQAEVLAVRISEELERQQGRTIPVRTDLLFRTKKTLPQKDLSAAERLKNLESAFEAGEIPPNIRRVILVDDIYTTGSTADACAKALKQAGVSNVSVVTACIGNQ